MSETIVTYEAVDEAYNLLQNGILVETSKGLVCMSLNDAISSDLNLSEEDLKNVATELISQQKIEIKSPPINFDSDGFSSECSDVNYVPLTPKAPPPPPKRRGGWPKGRKRKPELKNLPPKAPATGYNLYLNEQRKLFKDSKLVFHEITKIIGNKWSNLSLDEKRPYLAKAEEDKRRYREELKVYRSSEAYRAYLAKKRRNRLQNHVLSESDMDATDEIDDEDNEELYCRTCDQWFHNLHNKKEHLQGRQHTQMVAGDITKQLDQSDSGIFSTSLDESSLDGAPSTSLKSEKIPNTLTDCMTNLVAAVAKRENEIKALQKRLHDTCAFHNSLIFELNSLRTRSNKLKQDLGNLKQIEKCMEAKVAQLWQVPSWFIITDFNTSDFNETSE